MVRLGPMRLTLAALVSVAAASPHERRGDSPCDSDDPSDNAPTCPISSTAARRTSTQSNGSQTSTGTGKHASSTGSSTGTSATASSTSTSSAVGGNGIIHTASIVGIIFAVSVCSAVILTKTYRARRRAQRDEAALAAATAAALAVSGEKRPPVPPKPTNLANLNTMNSTSRYGSRSRSPGQANRNVDPGPGYYQGVVDPIPSPLTPGTNYRDSTTLLPMYGARTLPTSPMTPTGHPTRSSTYPPRHPQAYLTESTDELGYAQQQTHAASSYARPRPSHETSATSDLAYAAGGSQESLPNPFPLSVSEKSAAVRARTLPTISIPRRSGSGDAHAGPAVPPSPSQWLQRSPVAAAFPSGARPPSSYVPPASATGERRESTERDGLLTEMVGHQKQLEADAYAGRASGRGSLERSRSALQADAGAAQQSGRAVASADAPPRYSRD
ncbi:hypothetical protein HWV62_18952 [Athelia sp. TMB]|nr:hypothetical protein HWV62_18952 [Athelia sp. TMB]